MPYAGLPANMTGKMDRCVANATGAGKPKKRAIAICMASMTKELAAANGGYLPLLAVDDLLALYTAKAKEANIKVGGGMRDVILRFTKEGSVEKAKETTTPEPTTPEAEPLAAAIDEKMYMNEVPGGVTIYTPYGNSQSWDDLAEYRKSQVMEQTTRDATYEFERMVDNVLNDQNLTLAQKATKVAQLADGLPAHVDELQADAKELDLEGDPETVLEKIRTMFKAAPTKVVDGKGGFRAADFADVEDTASPSTWKLPLGDSPGTVSPTRVANAITAMQPGGFRGRKVQLGSERSKVTGRIRAAIGKLNVPDDRKAALTARLSKVKQAAFIVFKDATGQPRWFGWVSNKFRDRDAAAHPESGGEIIAEAAHKEFVAWVDADPAKRMPVLLAWHTPQSAHKHRADFVEYADGFLMESGPLTSEEADRIKAVEEDYDLGMSHGFVALARDDKEGVIQKYRQFESSYLPDEVAANPWTALAVLEKEWSDMGMNPAKKTFLTRLLGEATVADIETATADQAKALEAAGVAFKETPEPAAAPAAPAPVAPVSVPAAPAPAPAPAVVPASLPAVETEPEKPAAPAEDAKSKEYVTRGEVTEALGAMADLIREQTKALTAMAATVTALAKSDETKVAELAALTPTASLKDLILARAVGAESTVVDGRTKLGKSGPAETKAAAGTGTGIPLIDNIRALNDQSHAAQAQ